MDRSENAQEPRPVEGWLDRVRPFETAVIFRGRLCKMSSWRPQSRYEYFQRAHKEVNIEVYWRVLTAIAVLRHT